MTGVAHPHYTQSSMIHPAPSRLRSSTRSGVLCASAASSPAVAYISLAHPLHRGLADLKGRPDDPISPPRPPFPWVALSPAACVRQHPRCPCAPAHQRAQARLLLFTQSPSGPFAQPARSSLLGCPVSSERQHPRLITIPQCSSDKRLAPVGTSNADRIGPEDQMSSALRPRPLHLS